MEDRYVMHITSVLGNWLREREGQVVKIENSLLLHPTYPDDECQRKGRAFWPFSLGIAWVEFRVPPLNPEQC